MRTLTDHIVEGDSANHQLTIEVTGQPGQGGACHRYEITGFDTTSNTSAADGAGYRANFNRSLVIFHNGPIKEFGVNGVTQEALLAIVIDRLRSFQAGPFAGDYNARALACFEEGLGWLQQRTKDRMARGVEGTHQK